MECKVEEIPDTKTVVLGEGPHWDTTLQTLFFIDIFKGFVHSYKPSTNEHHSAIVGDGTIPVTLIIPLQNYRNKFVISLKNDLAIIVWDGKTNKTSDPKLLVSLEEKTNSHRINDGKADAEGRIWAGTMNNDPLPDGSFPPVGGFYRVDHCQKITKIFDEIIISNGLVWTKDNKKMYYIDSGNYLIDSFSFNLKTGELANRKTVFNLKDTNFPGILDGMTIDSEGKLFVANHGAGQILRICPLKGKILSIIKIPAPLVTSLAFGGENLDELYVTTANIDEERKHAPEDGINGCLYKVTNLGVRGLPMHNAKCNFCIKNRLNLKN